MPPLFQFQDGIGVEHHAPITERGYPTPGTHPQWNVASARALLRGLRSGAPGVWSDNRYEQSRHFLGVTYTAINARSNAIGSSTLHITQKVRKSREDSDELDEKNPGGKTNPLEEYSGRPKKSKKNRKNRSTGTAAPHELLYDREPVDEDHPLYQRLSNPNPHDTWADFLYEISLQLDLTGSALIWQVPYKLQWAAVPAELYVIPTMLAQPLPLSNFYPRGAYRVTPLSPYGPFSLLPGPVSGGAVIPGEQITRIKYKNPMFRYDGYSPLTAGAVQLDIMEQIDRSRWYAHKLGVHPSAAITVDPIKGANVTPEMLDRLQDSLDERYQGTNNYGKFMMLPPGVDINPWSAAPASMGFEAGWEQMRDFVLSLFEVPKGAIGIMDSYSYAGLYAALKAFYLISIKPNVDRIADHFTKFLAPYYGRGLKIHLELPSLDDPQLLEVQLGNDLRGKIRKRDEWRKLRRLPPLGGEEGEELVGGGGGEGQGQGQGGNPLGGEMPNLAGGGSMGAQKFYRLEQRMNQLEGRIGAIGYARRNGRVHT